MQNLPGSVMLPHGKSTSHFSVLYPSPQVHSTERLILSLHTKIMKDVLFYPNITELVCCAEQLAELGKRQAKVLKKESVGDASATRGASVISAGGRGRRMSRLPRRVPEQACSRPSSYSSSSSLTFASSSHFHHVDNTEGLATSTYRSHYP